MASLEEIRAVRLNKLALLAKAGMDAYPAKVPHDFYLAGIRANFADYDTGTAEKPGTGAHAGQAVSLTGRVMIVRGQGAILFAVLDDGTGTFQAVIKKDVLSPELFDLFTAAVDMGDVNNAWESFTTQLQQFDAHLDEQKSQVRGRTGG